MNTNQLKRFAQEARIKLLQQVTAKLERVLQTDSAELRERAEALRQLKEAIAAQGKEAVADKVAYTWFNRLVALRFMDANAYQPIGVSVISPKEGYTLPELLDEAKQGHVPDELEVDKNRLYNLLDGKVPGADPQNEAFRLLLIAACNQLHQVFPFLFERINDYTELLLPDDLISEFSVIQDIRDGMSEDDCKEVEILGWLYQFYISELNDELISSKKKYEKNELAPASQLFTPKWVVQYMVDNTLGQLWSEINPKTAVTDTLEFYIKPAYKDQLYNRPQKSIEEVKFFEPCVGSGHILSYAFDVFYKIYEEQGYNPSEIPELIITKNLYGVDIDERAAQIASFVLLMKGREKHRRFLRQVERHGLQPNISYYQDFENDNKFNNASALGSLIKLEPKEIDKIDIEEGSLFEERQRALKRLYQLLGQRYDVVVTNPPYINSSRMEGSLKHYVQKHWPEAKTDLFSAFILKCLELCNEDGLTGYMTPFVWMFISSYEKLREKIIQHHFINNLIQLEYSGFDGATVPICTFTLRNKNIPNAKGSYIRLSDFKGAKAQAPKTLEAIQNPDCGWFYTAAQTDFQKIPGSPMAFWASNNLYSIYANYPLADKYLWADGKNVTSDSSRFIRFYWEIAQNKRRGLINKDSDEFKWVDLSKGGEYRRWYGNLSNVINWAPKTRDYYRKYNVARIINENQWYREGISWTKISSNKLTAFRFFPEGGTFDDSGLTVFFDESNARYKWYFLGILNSRVFETINTILNQTLNLLLKDVRSLPIVLGDEGFVANVSEIVKKCVSIAKADWSKYEIGWDFKINPLVVYNGGLVENSYNLYKENWYNQFFKQKELEEELNHQIIKIYGLQEELTPDVPLEEITILKEETSIENGELVFHADEVFAQFVSYAVGCMFGRYSLDKEGLILANQGETLEDYLHKVGKGEAELQFVPDDDNIIPVLDDEWFEDDIVGRFYAFLKASFGEENFEKNLAFVEESLGKDIRKYFVKDFYKDHIKRYKKRPIYWMFSSPKGSFNVLIYMHRYTPDTLNNILNGYLKEYREKLKGRMDHLEHIATTGSSSEQTKATKEIEKIQEVLRELQEYEREILYPLATERIAIDLDDGVLVNYNKFGQAIKEVSGLNDKKTKAKVKKFDWIDTSTIR